MIASCNHDVDYAGMIIGGVIGLVAICVVGAIMLWLQ